MSCSRRPNQRAVSVALAIANERWSRFTSMSAFAKPGMAVLVPGRMEKQHLREFASLDAKPAGQRSSRERACGFDRGVTAAPRLWPVPSIGARYTGSLRLSSSRIFLTVASISSRAL